ncbi:MAG: GntR family transcriptional regulator [Atopobiaceae bacterium]|jgi:GntR family transcriptional regulator|nr:GntR family transcriptional regulator [Atopobiaceae bacterium]MCI2174203.1 GntR family transcriptional regulator [Atopobiaceae bacterium]MCI2206844.1 GntR family transcriptional regulator [Atopobiaceae bacterium]
MGTVSKKQPLYDQLVDILRDRIETELKPNDLLPSERELSERYGLSRTTVRLALQELENLGLIYRKHGKGTFVADMSDQAANLTQTYSFTEHMRELGRVPKTTILEFKTMEATKSIAAHMNLHIGDSVYMMKRLRAADDTPMMVERSYLPVHTFLSLTREDVEAKPLYEIVEDDYHEKIRVAEEEFYASIARLDDARMLGIAEGAPVLNLIRTTYNEGNEVIEYTLSVARADQFKYKVTHYRG